MRMTVNEIKEFVQNLRHRVEILVYRGWAIDGLINDYTKSADTIEKLLEEVQQYREIGSVEELKFLVENIGSIKSLKEYHAIGTIEEFKSLKEKSVAKKIVVKRNEDITFFLCPQCNKLAGNSIMRVESSHCSCCGQKLAWE